MNARGGKAPFDIALINAELAGFEWCGDIDEATPIESRFLAAIEVAGVPLHLEGVQVIMNDRQEQVAAYEASEEWLFELCALSHPDGRFVTLEIEGREYVVAAYPFTA